MYSPNFTYSQAIVKDLMSIERSRAIVELLSIPADVESALKDQAKLKMTHYSTKIEGNTLNLEQVARVIKQKNDDYRIPIEEEVRNYWEALSYLAQEKLRKTPISEEFIKKLHSIIVKQGSGRKKTESNYRGEMPPGVLFAVYDNKTRQPDYIPPEHTDVPELMKSFVTWLNNEDQIPTPIKAAIATYQLLTIHPFEDGNGRTARALASYILSIEDYDVKGFHSMEEYYVEDLDGYYRHLQMGLPVLYYGGRENPADLAPWIEYFVRIMALAYEKVANLSIKFTTTYTDSRVRTLEPKEKTLLRYLIERNRAIKPKEIADLFQVKSRTITNWAETWMEKGLIEPASGKQRITTYKIGASYANLTLQELGYRNDN